MWSDFRLYLGVALRPTNMDSNRTNATPQRSSKRRIQRYAWLLTIFWTLVLGISLGWSLQEEEHRLFEIARAQARAAFEKDLLFRRWNASHGGVYVPITEETQPNPHLEVAEQNIETPSGRKLTLVNPAYMTRQVHELQELTLGLRGHITSTKPIRPENEPDVWEREALVAFERGDEEMSSLETINGKRYMRLMRPLLTESPCLKCHEKQGYEEGDIRGGISVSVPIQHLLEISARHQKSLITAHALFWIFGLTSIGLGASRITAAVTKLHLSEYALAEKGAYLDSILYSSTDMAIVATDPDFRIDYYNAAAEELFGYIRAGVLGKQIAQLPQGCADVFRFKQASHKISQRGEYVYTLKLTGTTDTRSAEVRISGITTQDKELIGFVLLARDITQRLKATAIIEHQAHYDPLTDLPNRRTFTERLAQADAHAKRHGHHGALLFIDLDRFKAINDSHGHAVGDELLKQVAGRLKSTLRTDDSGGRLSGDEFVVLLEELEEGPLSLVEQATQVANKIHAALCEPYEIDGLTLSITISTGITIYPNDKTTPSGIIKQADIAMYQAKEDGRNTIHFFNADNEQSD
ncbi:MAG: diguanylate cyclase [Sedimenticola sp.]